MAVARMNRRKELLDELAKLIPTLAPKLEAMQWKPPFKERGEFDRLLAELVQVVVDDHSQAVDGAAASLSESLTLHRNSLEKAAKSSEKYARRLWVATVALAFVTAVLTIATFVMAFRC